MNLSPENRIAGVLAPLFALRSKNDLGVGDIEALREFVDWAHRVGFRLVQLLPINETGNDHSPYNAISSVAIEPTTLAVTPTELPDLTPEVFEEVVGSVDLAALRTGQVNYPVVKLLKRRLLERAFEHFSEVHWKRNTTRARKFRAWVRAQWSWIDGYALFRALMDENGGSEMWDHWPKAQQTSKSARVWLAEQPAAIRTGIAMKMRYFQYVQWIAFSQWHALNEACDARGVALMGDVPIGVSYYSSDVFSNPEIFELQWSGGAPPERIFKSDPFTEKWGQNWGVPLYRWDVLRKSDFAWWRQRVRMVREIFHLFRIDHILGFYRMYGFPWRPGQNGEFLPLTESETRTRTGGTVPRFTPRDDETAQHCKANRRDGEATLRALLEEVGEHRLVGEDLGVVPDYVRPSLAALGIAGFKIPQWERQADSRFIPGCEYERLSIATYATHDHPPLAVLWEELSSAAATGNGHQHRELRNFGEFGRMKLSKPGPFTREIHEGLLSGLFHSNSWIAITMITDLFGTRERFNVPGAVADSNWSERLPTIPQWNEDKTCSAKVERVAKLIQESGRV